MADFMQEIVSKVKDEWYLTDTEQLEYGLVDEIVTNLYDLLEE